MDFHPLGIVDTPAGPRQRVVLVAAQRDMIERLLAAVRRAGLSPEGVDLSAFALIRSLYRPDPEQTSRVLYLNVDGLTNLAIAEGTVCRFTRVVGSGLEGMASELAERRSIALTDARALLAGVNLAGPAPSAQSASVPEEDAPVLPSAGEVEAAEAEQPLGEGEESPRSVEQLEDSEREMSYEELTAVETAPETQGSASDMDVWTVLENGIRDISGEVRNSLDFHRSQEGGGEVSHVVLSGSVQDIPGFAEALQTSLGVQVHSQEPSGPAGELGADVSPHRLAIATGLAAAEAPQ
jgi:Tfp pilus assembly PilM family ATPase